MVSGYLIEIYDCKKKLHWKKKKLDRKWQFEKYLKYNEFNLKAKIVILLFIRGYVVKF